jgi:antitoxin (DNA-binding transcriptional repressor) of toxin-antitoxin stability system
METRITATLVARNLGDLLGRIRYRGDSFVIERNGVAVARLIPVAPPPPAPLGEALLAWCAGATDSAFARDLEAVGLADVPAGNPWG